MNDLFKNIVKIPSVSGNEKDLLTFLDKVLENVVDEIIRDPIGNNIKRIGNGKTKIMLEAHADEVGFIITYIDENGFAYFKPIGGIKKDIFVGQKVNILSSHGIMSGFIGKDPEKEIRKDSPAKDMWIDTGASKKSVTVKVGDIGYFDTSFSLLQNDCVLARGADNKVGVYVITELLKYYSKHQVGNIALYAALTTQEEIGMFGATAVTQTIKPHMSFIIETTDATDTPNADKEGEGIIVVGKGPVLALGPKTDNKLFTLFKDTAKKHKIPIQIVAQADETSTDTDVIQSSNNGTLTMLISIAVRYMHSPAVLFSWKDVEYTIQLLNKVLQEELHTAR
jgi:tetrahedral aminopeptidase